MKSLEIEAIDYIISWIENVGVTYDMEVSCYEEEFKKIKQDLEVLEIIKKKNVSLKDLKLSIQGFVEGAFETIEVVLWSYNLPRKEEEKLTLEELLKLKKWLEENE